MKIYDNVKKFAEASPELAETFKDYYNHVMATERKDNLKFATLKFSQERTLEEKETVINKLFAEELAKRSHYTVEDFDGSIVRYATNPSVKAFADSIVDYLIDMVLPETVLGSIGQICDFRFGGFGDSFKFDIENSALFSVVQSGRRQRTTPAQRLEKTTVTLAPINHQITVITNLPNVLANRDSIAKYMMKAIRSIETTMLYEIYDTFAQTMEGLTGGLMVASYKEADLIKACQTVTAWNQNRKAVIVGTAVALKSVLPSDLKTRILLQDDYVTMGYLRTFNGYDVIELPQIADYNSDSYGLKLRDDRLYIISPASDKLMKCAVEGESITHTTGQFDQANLSQEGTTNKAWATACITNSVGAVIKLA